MSFVQLHAHSYFSILDGVCSPEEIASKARGMGMPAAALTDHGSLSGALRFSNACNKEGIKPIIGCEMYINNSRDSKKSEEKNSHVVILVKSQEGYKNLLWLNYDAMLNGFYYRGRTTDKLLFSRSDGLIVTTACLGSRINRYILAGERRKAEKLFLEYKYWFKEDFYGELLFNELEDQLLITPEIYRLCRKHKVKWIVTGDCHYINEGDDKTQDMLLLINQRKKISDENVFRFSTRHLWYHDIDDYITFNTEFGFNMEKKVILQGLENTLEVADKCNFYLKSDKCKFPRYLNEEGYEINSAKILSDKALHKLKNIEIPLSQRNTYNERLSRELKVIIDKDFSDYFLIIKDIVDFCKKKDIGVGAGRGSAAGSLVSYLLGITDRKSVV